MALLKLEKFQNLPGTVGTGGAGCTTTLVLEKFQNLPGTRHPALGARHLAPGTQRPAPGARRPASGKVPAKSRHPALLPGKPPAPHPAVSRHPAPGTQLPGPCQVRSQNYVFFEWCFISFGACTERVVRLQPIN